MANKLNKVLLALRNRFHPSNHYTISPEAVFQSEANILATRITIEDGNAVICHEGVRLSHLSITVVGRGNEVLIHRDVIVSGTIELFGNNNVVEIGAETTINGAFVAAHNGRRISIGKRCLFSSGIDIRTTDSHKIFDSSGVRINDDKDVVIGDNVWIGRGVSILKGASIGEGAVIGTMSVVSGAVEGASIYAGVPARKIRSDIRWEA